MNKFSRFVKDESGATAIEYGLIAVALAVLLVAITPSLTSKIAGLFSAAETQMSTGAAWTADDLK